MSKTRRALSSLGPGGASPFERGAARGLARKTLLVIVAAVAGLALLWTLAVGWALPRFAQPRIEAAASEALGAPLRLGRLEVAPWSLVVTVSDLVLGPADAPWLKLAQAQADLSTESLWRLAPVLERLSLREPQLRLERLAADRYNVTPMLEALARRPSDPGPSKPVHFALYNIRLQDGRIELHDRVSNREHLVESLQIGVPFVSNLPSKLAVDVEPLLDARVNGSRLLAQGKTQPFHEGQRSTIAIDWQQIDLARWVEALAPLLPAPQPVTVTEGQLALALQIAFERKGADAPPALRISGGAKLDQLRAALPEQGVQVGWGQLAVEGLDLEPLARRADVAAVRLQAPEAQIDLQRLLAPKAEAPTPSPPTPARPASAPTANADPQAAWQWKVGEIDVAEGSASLQHPAWPQGQRVAPLTLKLKGLDSRADAAPATLALALKDAQGGAFKLDATASPAAAKAEGTAEAEGFDVPVWLAPWQLLLPVQVRAATASLGAKAEVSASGWTLRDARVALDGLKLQPADAGASKSATADRLSVKRVALDGVEASGRFGDAAAAPSVHARSLDIDGLDLQASRRKNGAIGWMPKDATPAPSAPTAKREAPPLRWKLDQLRCSGCSLAFTDEAVEPASSVALQRSELTLKKLGDDLGQSLGFELATQARQGGRIKLAGTLRPQPLSLRGRVDVAALDLRMLQPYLRPHANVELATAKLGAVGDVTLDGDAKTAVAAARWRGRFGLAELRVLDSLNQAELLRFKSFQLDAADVQWRADAPVQADLGAVSLQDFYSRIIVNADGRLNLLDIVKREGQDAPKSLTTPTEKNDVPAPASAPTAHVPDAARAQLRWRSVALAGGTVDFTDNFIRPNYSAKLTELNGSVAALAWDDPQPAAIAVAGKVDGSAPLEISGSVHPLGARLATDITASARGIDITRLTGYSGRYAGYGIEKGTLSVKVRYKIANGQLEADNNLYLDQLTFGDKVDSPDALKLPVLLAVSLLKDRNGVIDLDLPIRGSLDDPQFSVGGIIVKVIVNLITKAITAPFSLLANAFGGGGQELGHVDFGPGSSELSDASRQRLDTLAKALNDRPALRLEATGHADAARDDAALRAQHLDRLMRVAKAKATGELADSVKIEPAERARWLEAAYKAADLKDKPRNLIGLNKSLPAAEMEALLLKNAPAGEAALKSLADERGDRVKAYLVTKVPPERVLLTASKLGAPAGAEGGSASSVVFGLK